MCELFGYSSSMVGRQVARFLTHPLAAPTPDAYPVAIASPEEMER